MKHEEPMALSDAHFIVSSLGGIEDFTLPHSKKRLKEADVIDKIEEAQIFDRLPRSSTSAVLLSLSKHGMTVTEPSSKHVTERHPLRNIALVVLYEDPNGSMNLAFVFGSVGGRIYSCSVFQCSSREQGRSICQLVKQVFLEVTSASL